MLIVLTTLFISIIESSGPVEGEYLINPVGFPRYTLARSGNTLFAVEKENLLKENAYNTVPPKIIANNPDPYVMMIKLSERFICIDWKNDILSACNNQKYAKFGFVHNGDGSLRIQHYKTNECLSIGESDPKNKRYYITKDECNEKSIYQKWELIPVSSKQNTNISFVNSNDLLKPSGHKLFTIRN